MVPVVAVGAVSVVGFIIGSAVTAVTAVTAKERRARERRRRAEAEEWQAMVQAGDREREAAYKAKNREWRAANEDKDREWGAAHEAKNREWRAANEAKTTTLYHYTTENGRYGFLKSGVIYASSSSHDAAFGKGVYLTSIKPCEHPETILYNNYDDSKGAAKDNWKKVAWVIEVALPWKEVKKAAKHQAGGRDIYVYNKDLNLRSYNCTTYRNGPNY